ncbi:PIR protein [Plasmodium ovale]|uniref:PIR protein n=2 Tax=Plasmodium ovale TaxID=36330 RepID=A0A1D3JBT7_PLAOA|nr:PIR Superfamily Protein [Plasmodium ovale curtisi]SBT82958.1 PIR protein [Plasmodium ovale]SBT83255.1 PIR protein [Plasmodium ovale]
MASEFDYRKILKIFGHSSKELFSEKFYEALDNDYSGISKHRQHCRDIFGNKKKNKMKKLCERVLKYLEKSSKWNANKTGYDDCVLLNFWVYNTIAKYFSQDTSYINIAFSSIEKIWKYLVDDPYKEYFYQKCKPLFKENLNYDDWEKRKQLYDYYVDSDTLFKTARDFKEKCEEYYQKIEKAIPLYEHFEQVCSDQSMCPKFYDSCQQYNPKSLLPQLPCDGKIKSERAAAAKVSAPKHGKELEQEPGSAFDKTVMISESSQIGTKVAHSVLGVAPVLLTATALYRYTPVGSWVRKLGGYSPNSINDMNGGEMEEFLDNTQESGDMFFGSGENYISYQSM